MFARHKVKSHDTERQRRAQRRTQNDRRNGREICSGLCYQVLKPFQQRIRKSGLDVDVNSASTLQSPSQSFDTLRGVLCEDGR